MVCCVCSLLGSKSWMLLLVPIFAMCASFSSGHDAHFISIITLSLLVVLFSTLVYLKLSKQKPNIVQIEQDKLQDGGKLVKESEQELLIQPQDMYSESDSLDQFSTTSSDEEHERRLDFSDDDNDSISDEESLIEIAIPSGEFVSPNKGPNFNFKCCKKLDRTDFCVEEDNLIEIDIYMGSIKCSSYVI